MLVQTQAPASDTFEMTPYRRGSPFSSSISTVIGLCGEVREGEEGEDGARHERGEGGTRCLGEQEGVGSRSLLPPHPPQRCHPRPAHDRPERPRHPRQGQEEGQGPPLLRRGEEAKRRAAELLHVPFGG